LSEVSTEFPGLEPAPPPIEPKLAYPEPQLLDAEQLALIHGCTFFAGTREGDLTPPGAPHIGLFHDDTRFLSHLELRINGQKPIVLSSTTVGADAARIELTVRGGSINDDKLDLPLNTIYVHREQLLYGGNFFDVLEIQSYHDEEAKLVVELLYSADFMDIFQVRGLLRGKSGRYFRPDATSSGVVIHYEGLDNRARTTRLSFSPRPQVTSRERASWELRLLPHKKEQITTIISMAEGPSGGRLGQPSGEPGRAILLEDAREQSRIRHEQWIESCTRLRSDNEIFDRMLQTAMNDFYALRMPEECGTAVAAGVPWFAALFGRDSLLSGYQTLLLDPELAQGTLRVLACYQGGVRNDERDEAPGKILHERRSGEMTATNEVPFGRSYGSVDATPLFLILLRAYFDGTAEYALLHELKEPMKAATNWLLHYADLDGDGLVEYCRRNPKGLFNQGWKDSGDANRHADGQIAQPPIALIEVQGYAVRAFAGVSDLLHLLNEDELAVQTSSRSEHLRNSIEERFWIQDRSYYAMALDREKRSLQVDSSNPGHLLFSAAISGERARQVSERLLSKNLFSGWGIRTLSSSEAYFNPMSYHCGSVWPHDNSIIGYGMALYGLHREASIIFQSLYETALRFRDYRLPELFCGIARQGQSEPVHYPVSCSPQAWASGSSFLLLTGLLGLRPNAKAAGLEIIDPHLPAFLNNLRIENLRIGASRVTLDFKREGERTHCNVIDVQGDALKVSIVLSSNALVS
jgi:glycogen debranching enzyme